MKAIGGIRGAWAVVIALAAPAWAAACGSRTGLLDTYAPVAEPDGGIVAPPPPGSDDAGQDAALPPLDAAPLRDGASPLCADASDTLIYVVTSSNLSTGTGANRLLRFDPASASFSIIGDINCPDPNGGNPFSMAVNREGIAYVLYSAPANISGTGTATVPGHIFRVSLATAECEATSFVAPTGFYEFGMAFSADTTGTGETLYVASDDPTSGVLASINETTLALAPIAQITPAAAAAELSGSADGRLFAFFSPTPPADMGTGMTVGQIDKTTAQLSAETFLPSVDEGDAWAFAFYGGSFYLFTSPADEGSTVTRFNPSDGSLTQIATWPDLITGAGVSTCAPAQ